MPGHSQKEYFLRRIKTQSGYVMCPPQQNIDDLEDRAWQFRISVFPNKENLEKAAIVLADIFEGLEFKCLMLNDEERDDVRKIPWDGTSVGFDQGGASDRDQRGKEVCVYMRFDSQEKAYEAYPSQWKELMLTAWRALQDAGVEIGYITPPVGDKEIIVTGENGDWVTPFSYTSNKPWQGRHGILLESVYNPNPKLNHSHNPNGYDDPLEGVVFTETDLLNAGIQFNALKDMQKKRIAYQTEHLKESKANIITYLQSVNFNKNIFLSIKSIIDELKNLENPEDKINFIKAKEEEIRWIAVHFPRKADTSLSQTNAAGTLQHYLTEVISGESKELGNFEAALTKLYQSKDAEQEIQETLNDFAHDKWVMDFLGHNINTYNLEPMIKADPAGMQLAFRKLIHIRDEEIALTKEQQRAHEVKKVPKALGHIGIEDIQRGVANFSNIPTDNLGLMIIFTGLSKNPDIYSLNLSHCDLNSQDAEYIAERLLMNNTITEINLEGNKINPALTDKINQILDNNLLNKAEILFNNIYHPENYYTYQMPLKMGNEYLATKVEDQSERHEQTLVAIQQFCHVDSGKAIELFNRLHGDFIASINPESLRQQNTESLVKQIINKIFDLDGKVGIFGGETFTIGDKEITVSKHVGYMLDFYIQNGLDNCDHEKFIDECIKQAEEAPSKNSLSFLNSRKTEVQEFYDWLKQIKKPELELASDLYNLILTT